MEIVEATEAPSGELSRVWNSSKKRNSEVITIDDSSDDDDDNGGGASRAVATDLLRTRVKYLEVSREL